MLNECSRPYAILFQQSNMLKQKYLILFFAASSAILLVALILSRNQIIDCRQTVAYYREAVNVEDAEEKTITYTNQVGEYSFSVPADLDVTSFDNGVSIGTKDGPGITVETHPKSRYATKEAWLDDVNSNLQASEYVIDGEIIIADKSAILAHEISENEEYFSPQVIIFEAGDKLFVIKTPPEHLKLITESFLLNQ